MIWDPAKKTKATKSQKCLTILSTYLEDPGTYIGFKLIKDGHSDDMMGNAGTECTPDMNLLQCEVSHEKKILLSIILLV